MVKRRRSGRITLDNIDQWPEDESKVNDINNEGLLDNSELSYLQQFFTNLTDESNPLHYNIPPLFPSPPPPQNIKSPVKYNEEVLFKRKRHVMAEHKRKDRIKVELERLEGLLPEKYLIGTTSNGRKSQAKLLAAASDCISQLRRENDQLKRWLIWFDFIGGRLELSLAACLSVCYLQSMVVEEENPFEQDLLIETMNGDSSNSNNNVIEISTPKSELNNDIEDDINNSSRKKNISSSTSSSKLTIQVFFEGRGTDGGAGGKSVRLSSSQKLSEFLHKLQKKGIITSGIDSLDKVKCSIRSVSDEGFSFDLGMKDFERRMSELGINDNDHLILTLPDQEEGKKKKKESSSLLARFKNAAGKTLRSSTNSTTTLQQTEQQQEQQEEEHSTLSSVGLLFGVPLEIIGDLGAPLISTKYPGVPSFIELAFAEIMSRGSEVEGVFRLSGSASTLKTLKKSIDMGEVVEWSKIDDIHAIAGIIKQYLRELPESLIIPSLFLPFYYLVSLSEGQGEAEGSCDSVQMMKFLMNALPTLNRQLLLFILKCACEFASFEENTRMGISNLATIFGPNLVRPHNMDLMDQGEMLQSMSRATSIISYLLKHYSQITDLSQPSNASTSAIAQAVYGREGEEEDEVDLVEGDIIFVEDRSEEWWTGWVLHLNENSNKVISRFGKYPGNYVQVIYESPLAHVVSPVISNIIHETEEAVDIPPVEPALTLDSLMEKINILEHKICYLESELDSERKERQGLSIIIPELMKNQDEVLRLLQSINN